MDQDKANEAKRLAARAGKQARDATKNTGRAAEEAAGAVVEPVVDGAEQAAQTVIRDVTNTTDLTKGVFALVGATALAFFAARKFKASTATIVATRGRKVG